MRKLLAVGCGLWAVGAALAVGEKQTLWKGGDGGIKVYRIPAICTAPNGDLVAACDARARHGGDLNAGQPINISIRRSADGGRTWSAPANSYTWPWEEDKKKEEGTRKSEEGNGGKWAGSDPSFAVDKAAKKIFLFYNVWHVSAGDRVFRFYVQESADDGKTWSKPRDISKDIAIAGWPCGKSDKQGGFIFISSGSGIQLNDAKGTILHTLVHVGDGNALFGTDDHGKTWKPFGKPAKCGDECKVVELADGSWMINSRWRGGGRQIHVSKDKGMTWESRYDKDLKDPQCNAQIMRYGKRALLFSNCNSGKRENLCLRASLDEGKTWSAGISICPGGSAYSDITMLKNGDVGVLYEGAGYGTIDFVTVSKDEIAADCKTMLGK